MDDYSYSHSYNGDQAQSQSPDSPSLQLQPEPSISELHIRAEKCRRHDQPTVEEPEREPCQYQQHPRNKTYRRRSARTRVAAHKCAFHRGDCQFHEQSQPSKESKAPKKRCSGGDAGTTLGLDVHVYPEEDQEEESQTRDNLTVIVRIRPRKKCEVTVAKTLVKVTDHRTLFFDPKVNGEEFYFHGVKQKVHDCSRRPNKNISFVFDEVYGPKSTNVEIFENSLKHIVGHIIRGYSCSIFAYGATGSGKTFTMLGNSANPGLSFLMAMELYKRIGEIGNEYESEVVVSYLEVYNESLKDLLHPSDSLLSIRENGLNGVSIPNLTKHKPKDATAMLRLLSYGNNHRTQHPTDHNSESSRSHAIFEVGVSLRRKFTHLSVKYKMTKAKLVMIDLAGSERSNGNSGPVAPAAAAAMMAPPGARTREGSNINKSLLALGNCINALADGKKHVPYRDSKLTRILKDSLGGNCKTVMITNISPTSLNYDDTYNSLKYADRAKQIKITCKKNVLVREIGIGEPGQGRGRGNGHIHAECDKLIQDLHAEIVQLKNLVGREHEASRALIGEEKSVHVHTAEPVIAMNTSPLVSLTHVVHDPAALENFIQLLSTKRKNEESHVEASLKAKEAEWGMLWREWRIETIKALGTGRLRSQEQTHLMKTSLQKLKQEMDQYASTHALCQEQMQLAKQVLDYNEKEIAHLRRNALASLKLEYPFIALTLAEFLHYKGLEREVAAHKNMENHHQTLCTQLLNEVLQSDTLLTSSLQFQQTLWRLVNENGVSVSEKCRQKYTEIIRAAYGFVKVSILPTLTTGNVASASGTSGSTAEEVLAEKRSIEIGMGQKRKKQLTESAQALQNVLASPSLDYEPPPTTASTIQTQTATVVVPTHLKSCASAPPAFVVKAVDSLPSIASSCTFTEISSGADAGAFIQRPCPEQNELSSVQSLTSLHMHMQPCHRHGHRIMPAQQQQLQLQRLQPTRLKMLTLQGAGPPAGADSQLGPCIYVRGGHGHGHAHGQNEICIMGSSASIKTLLVPKSDRKTKAKAGAGVGIKTKTKAKGKHGARKKGAIIIKPQLSKKTGVKAAFGRTCPASAEEEVKKKLDKVRQVAEEQKHAELGVVGIPVQKLAKSEAEAIDEGASRKRMAKKKKLRLRADVARRRMEQMQVSVTSSSSTSKESTLLRTGPTGMGSEAVTVTATAMATSEAPTLTPKPAVVGRPFTRYKARDKNKAAKNQHQHVRITEPQS